MKLGRESHSQHNFQQGVLAISGIPLQVLGHQAAGTQGSDSGFLGLPLNSRTSESLRLGPRWWVQCSSRVVVIIIIVITIITIIIIIPETGALGCQATPGVVALFMASMVTIRTRGTCFLVSWTLQVEARPPQVVNV